VLRHRTRNERCELLSVILDLRLKIRDVALAGAQRRTLALKRTK
jgi:hypothetical protein